MSLSCKLATIHRIHSRLVDEFAPHVDGEIDICPKSHAPELLQESRIHGPIRFELRSDIQTTLQSPHRLGAWASPLSGFGNDPVETAWVHWWEDWSKAMRHFTLRRVGFTFAWGRSSRVTDTLFRAEWDQALARTERAAHPHWHVDTLLPDCNTSLSRIHLGMSGWRGPGAFPACWQSVANEDELVLWASRMLEYSCQQIHDFFPAAT